MKTRIKIQLLALVLVSTFSLQRSAFAQGALTPPGPPAPTMKSLQHIAVRVLISSVISH